MFGKDLKITVPKDVSRIKEFFWRKITKFWLNMT